MGPSKELIMIGVRQPSLSKKTSRRQSSKHAAGQAAFFVFPPLEEIQDELKLVGRIQAYVVVGINSHKHVQILPWGDQNDDSSCRKLKSPQLKALYIQDIFDNAASYSDDCDSSPPLLSLSSTSSSTSASWCKFVLSKKRSKVASC